jgi:hypothetical protein
MHLILVGYSSDATRRALDLCGRTFTGLVDGRRLLVWNGPGTFDTPPPGWTSIRGSNRLAEFSAWQEGLDHLAADIDEPVLFVNDTLGMHRHPSVLRRWALRSELVRSADAALVGFSDQAVPPPGKLAIAGLPLRDWLSTYCFSLPPALLGRLGGEVYDESEVASCVPGGTDEEAFFSELVSPDLAQHLRWWLFGGGWYRSAPVDAANAAALTTKARCICAELLLAARAESWGFELRDPLRHRPTVRRLEAVHGELFARTSAHRRESRAAGRTGT